MLKSAEQRFWNFLKSFSPRLHDVLFQNRKLIVYIISGGTAAVVELGSLYFFKGILGLKLIPAVSLAFILAFCVSFLLQKFWTFEDRSVDQIHKQATKYFIITGTNFFLNLFLMYVLVEILHVWYMLAKFLISGGIAFFSFFVYRMFVFKDEIQS
jgi:putative flippase GtrA